MILTEGHLRAVFPDLRNPDDFVEPLNYTFEKFSINTRPRIAAFLAQTGHESAHFKAMRENLNYSRDALLRVFPRHFPTVALAESYARQPERIANRVYANRMGNGDEASGDGWKFRGRGLIQLTGRQNVSRFAEYVGLNLDEAISYLETVEGACMGAGWFWHVNNLNRFADSGDFDTLTRRINGGVNGLADRRRLLERAQKSF
jgi:putative chitinase